MAALDPQADDRFKATVRANYQELADLLIERGRLPEAQQVLTMLKEQEVFEYQGRETTRDARKTTLDLTDREAQWYKGFQSAAIRLPLWRRGARRFAPRRAAGH